MESSCGSPSVVQVPSIGKSFLIIRTGALRCALPISVVREVMRPLRIKAAGGLLPGVLGAAIVRGNPLPVISLGVLLRQPEEPLARFVVVRTPGRDCVLACASIESITGLDDSEWQRLPTLLESIEAAQQIAVTDRDLVVTLDMAWVSQALPPPEEELA